jgi:hypothetical protein
MPTTPQYNPTDPQPYQPAQLPESATAPPPQQVETPAPFKPSSLGFGGGGKGALGGIASMGDSILRGYMKGKAQADQIKALKLKKQADAAQYSYNNDAEKYLDMVKRYGDPKKLQEEKKKIEGEIQSRTAQASAGDPALRQPTEDSSKQAARLDEINSQLKEFDQARGAVDTSWKNWMGIYGAQITPQGKGKKKKQDQNANPIQQAFSKDPQEKMEGIYGTLLKLGPPVYIQANQLGSKQAQADQKYGGQNAENEARKVELQSKLADLTQQDTSKMDDAAKAQHDGQIQQTKDAISALGGTASQGAAKYFAPRYGPNVTGTDLKKMYPNGVPGPSGTFTPADGDAYREVIYGESGGQPMVRYEPMTVSGQLKTTADASGQPVQRVFNPLTKTWEGAEVGKVPQKGQYIKIDGRDANGNPTTLVVPFMPQYKHQMIAPPKGTKVDKPIDVGSEGAVKEGAQLIGEGERGGGEQPLHNVPPKATKPTPEHHKSKTVEDHLKQADKVAQESGVPHGAIAFQKYSKDNQGAAKAIAGQELTINGMPGSKTDIGLRKSTLNVLRNKEDLQNISVAMRALDSLAKTQSAGHDSSDYGWLAYFKDNWSAIPAVNEALSKVSPAGQTYLTNFFRAWTNAATIRSLQGSSGKPQQAMYAMLSNELPVLGVNVQDEAQATQKLNTLQDDVDVAKGFLPKDMQEELDKKFPRSAEPAEHHAAAGEKKESDEEIQERLNKKYAPGAKQPAGVQPPG